MAYQNRVVLAAKCTRHTISCQTPLIRLSPQLQHDFWEGEGEVLQETPGPRQSGFHTTHKVNWPQQRLLLCYLCFLFRFVSTSFSVSYSSFFSISLHSTTRYAPDVSHVPDDFTTEFLARRDSCSNVRRWEARNMEVEEEEKYSKRGTNLK